MLNIRIDKESGRFEITANGSTKELAIETMLVTSAIYTGIKQSSLYKKLIMGGVMTGLAFQDMSEACKVANGEAGEADKAGEEEQTIDLSEILKELNLLGDDDK